MRSPNRAGAEQGRSYSANIAITHGHVYAMVFIINSDGPYARQA